MKKIIIIILLIVALAKIITYNTAKHNTAIVLNPISEKYDLEWYPENARRITYIINSLKRHKLFTKVSKFKAREATTEELLLAHNNEYISSVKKWSEEDNQKTWLSTEKWSSYPSKYAYKSAATAVGGLIDLTEKVANKEFQNGFALIRPPGHHATANKGMGFCIFNNVAIASLNLLNKNLAKNILIIDFDAHHGNGIEDIVKNRQGIQYVSVQQQYTFPHFLDSTETQIYSKNIPFKFPQSEHIRLIKGVVNQAIKNQKPDFILVAAGYDAHWRDYMSNLAMTSQGYGELSEFLISIANEHADRKIVFSLEGGYDPEALAEGVTNTVKALIGERNYIDTIGSEK